MIVTVIVQRVSNLQTLPHVPDVVKTLLLPAIKITSWGGTPHYMTPFDISQLPLVKFAKLYSVRLQHMCSGEFCKVAFGRIATYLL